MYFAIFEDISQSPKPRSCLLAGLAKHCYHFSHSYYCFYAIPVAIRAAAGVSIIHVLKHILLCFITCLERCSSWYATPCYQKKIKIVMTIRQHLKKNKRQNRTNTQSNKDQRERRPATELEGLQRTGAPSDGEHGAQAMSCPGTLRQGMLRDTHASSGGAQKSG